MNTGRVAPLLNSAPLVWLGNISYSLYLAHGFVQFVATRLLAGGNVRDPADLSDANSIGLLCAMVGTTLLIAMFTYSEIEITGRSRIRQLLQPKRLPATSAQTGKAPAAPAGL